MYQLDGTGTALTGPGTINDYSGSYPWSGVAAMFGVCLQSTNANVDPGWTIDGNGDCTTVDSDPWRAVTATSGAASVVGETTFGGAQGVARFRYGLQTGTSTTAGTYTADLTIEAISVALPPPPVNTVAPALTGTAREYQTLTGNNGTWNGSPTSFTYAWQTCTAAGTGCVNITGPAETTTSYDLRAADNERTVRLAVTATNIGGSTTAYSAVSGVIEPEAPVGTIVPVDATRAAAEAATPGWLALDGTHTAVSKVTYSQLCTVLGQSGCGATGTWALPDLSDRFAMGSNTYGLNTVQGSGFGHSHTYSLVGHSHAYTVPGHTHSLDISHTHTLPTGTAAVNCCAGSNPPKWLRGNAAKVTYDVAGGGGVVTNGTSGTAATSLATASATVAASASPSLAPPHRIVTYMIKARESASSLICRGLWATGSAAIPSGGNYASGGGSISCGGTSPTADFRGRIPVGAGTYAVGATGGSSSHTHSVAIGNHTHSGTAMPAHTHTAPFYHRHTVPAQCEDWGTACGTNPFDGGATRTRSFQDFSSYYGGDITSGNPSAASPSVSTTGGSAATTGSSDTAAPTVTASYFMFTGAQGTIPAGTIALWLGTTTPSGWRRANGVELAQTTNPDLFAAIGTRYCAVGGGCAAGNYRIPDLRDNYLLGSTTAAGAVASGGALTHRHSLAVPDHTHSVTIPTHYHNFDLPAHGHTLTVDNTAALQNSGGNNGYNIGIGGTLTVDSWAGATRASGYSSSTAGTTDPDGAQSVNSNVQAWALPETYMAHFIIKAVD